MNCNLNTVYGWLSLAIVLLAAAIGIAGYWPLAWPLLLASALMASIYVGIIPKLRQAILDYAACRGPSAKCNVSNILHNIAKAISLLSAVSFALAGAMQIAALAFLFSFFLAWIGVGIEVAVAVLVTTGVLACGAALVLLTLISGDVAGFKRCMDEQQTVGGAVPPTTGP